MEVRVLVTADIDLAGRIDDADLMPAEREQLRAAAVEAVNEALELRADMGFEHTMARVASIGIRSVEPATPEEPPAGTGEWTVLLLCPDYLGTDNSRGFATFLGHGTGSPETAVAQVRQQAADANNADHEDDFTEPMDFAVLAVFKGKHEDINPEA